MRSRANIVQRLYRLDITPGQARRSRVNTADRRELLQCNSHLLDNGGSQHSHLVRLYHDTQTASRPLLPAVPGTELLRQQSDTPGGHAGEQKRFSSVFGKNESPPWTDEPDVRDTA